MLISRNADVEERAINAIEGLPVHGDVTVKPLIGGDRMVMLEIHYTAGSGSPVHAHQHESLCYVVSGRAEATVGDGSFTLGPGDVCRHPEGVAHGINAIEDTTVIEVKSPAQPLEEFLG